MSPSVAALPGPGYTGSLLEPGPMPDDAQPPAETLAALMHAIGRRARAAARPLALAEPAAKDMALRSMAAGLREAAPRLLAANARDVEAARARGTTGAFLDRLELTPARAEAMAAGLEAVAALPDPVGRVLAAWTRPSGLAFERVAVPLGVVGVIFESRPGVCADAGALCLKAGNAVVLRGGSESQESCTVIAEVLRAGLAAAGLPQDAVQIVPTRDRSAVGAMLAGLDGALDVIVPRGGRSLVERVQREARVPVFAHLDGLNATYLHAPVDLPMACEVVLNAKLRRPGVCGATETLLVDAALASTHLAPILAALLDAGCAVRGDSAACSADPRVTPASPADYDTEFLDAVLACRVVDGLDEAMAHIAAHGSHHTDAILTEDEGAADRFLREVDSAIVLHNASTQFADGAEFGFGAEIGIATGRMHARGPVGVDQLCSFNYRVRGTGTVRP